MRISKACNPLPSFTTLLSASFLLVAIAAPSFALKPLLSDFTFVTDSTDAGFTQTLPDSVNAESYVSTSIPGTFTGASINNLLGADTFYNNGITGQGATVANVEAGHIWAGHESLGHVGTFSHHPDAFGTTTNDLVDRHATWVAQMIGGRTTFPLPGSEYQRGISPSATLQSGAIATTWNGGAYSTSFGINANSFSTPLVNYFGSADVINSSWGFSDPDGNSAFTVAMDGLADMNPNTTFVVSAGNSGPGANTVGAPGAGYNAITVGALQNDGANNYNTIAGFSSRGPQDYSDPVNGLAAGARAAVDITAPGASLTAAYYGGQTGGNNSGLAGSPSGPAGGPGFYSGGIQGTSFSSPITAGAATLINSASYNTPALAGNPASRDARVVKAVLLNSADKVPGWDNGQVPHPNGNGGVFTTQSLDFTYGAGALDIDQAYQQYIGNTTKDVPGTPVGNQGFVDPVGWDFGSVQASTDNIYPIAQPLVAGTDFTVTLDWFRDRTFIPATFTTVDTAQADLDVRLVETATGNVISESISALDVVEHLHFTIPSTAHYQIEVEFFGNVFGSLNSEEYGLAWFGTAVPEPSSLMLAIAFVASLAGTRNRRSA